MNNTQIVHEDRLWPARAVRPCRLTRPGPSEGRPRGWAWTVPGPQPVWELFVQHREGGEGVTACVQEPLPIWEVLGMQPLRSGLAS